MSESATGNVSLGEWRTFVKTHCAGAPAPRLGRGWMTRENDPGWEETETLPEEPTSFRTPGTSDSWLSPGLLSRPSLPSTEPPEQQGCAGGPACAGARELRVKFREPAVNLSVAQHLTSREGLRRDNWHVLQIKDVA